MSAKNNDSKYFLTTESHEVPHELKPLLKKAKRLEWVTIGYLISVVVIMFITLGSSQAMKTAWLEDMLGLVPATVFLIAYAIYDKRPPGYTYLYGFHKVFTVAFLLGSFALLGMGLFAFYESVMALIKHEHPTIKHITLFNHTIWFGWIMIIALTYSFIPAVFLGRAKLPLAHRLHNKILHTDANTQKADWQTAGAAIAGIIGIGFGLWWADAVAAIIISLNIMKDGFKRTKDAVSDIIGQIPMKIGSAEKLPLNYEIHNFFKDLDWVEDVRIRLRENGQVLFGEVFIIPIRSVQDTKQLILKIEQAYKDVKKLDWKVHDLVIQPVRDFAAEDKE